MAAIPIGGARSAQGKDEAVSATDEPQGLVLGPEAGPSFWQPVPANGHAVVKLSPESWSGSFSMGVQVVAPHSFIRSHTHDRHDEAIFVWRGHGRAVVGGCEHPIEPGSTIGLPRDVEHGFINDSGEDLTLIWVMAPHGLAEFFAAIGRPRRPGEPAPAPFPRPADVAAIEAATVFKVTPR